MLSGFDSLCTSESDRFPVLPVAPECPTSTKTSENWRPCRTPYVRSAQDPRPTAVPHHSPHQVPDELDLLLSCEEERHRPQCKLLTTVSTVWPYCHNQHIVTTCRERTTTKLQATINHKPHPKRPCRECALRKRQCREWPPKPHPCALLTTTEYVVNGGMLYARDSCGRAANLKRQTVA